MIFSHGDGEQDMNLPRVDVDDEDGMTETMAISTIDHLFSFQSLSDLMDYLQQNSDERFATYGNYQDEKSSYTYGEIYSAVKNFIDQFSLGFTSRKDVLSALKTVPILSTATNSREKSLGQRVIELWNNMKAEDKRALIQKHRKIE